MPHDRNANPLGAPHWPTEIRLKKAEKVLDITFDDGRRFRLPAEYLRVESPSAEVQGHGGSDRQIVGGKRYVAITDIEPVGNYAVRLLFDDGHDSGLYSWKYLYELGETYEARWARYLFELEARSLSRDPR